MTQKIILVFGASGIGKSSLCRTTTRLTTSTRVKPPPSGTPMIPENIPSFSADHQTERNASLKMEAILNKIKESKAALCVVDVTPRQLSAWEHLPNKAIELGFDSIEIVVLAEEEKIARNRMLNRNPKREESSIKSALNDQKRILDKATKNNWHIGTQAELACYIKNICQ